MHIPSFFKGLALPLAKTKSSGLLLVVVLLAMLALSSFDAAPVTAQTYDPAEDSVTTVETAEPPIKEIPSPIAPKPPTPSPPPGSPGSPASGPIKPLRVPFGYGVNVWAYNMREQTGGILQKSTGAGMGWVRQQLRWDYIEMGRNQFRWNELDVLMAAVSKHNIKIMLSIAKAPGWASPAGGLPTNSADFYNFMFNLSQRYRGQVAAYEIWNEPNIGLETGGQVSVSRYVATLKAGYTAVKKNDAGAVVVTGGTSPTGITNGTQVMEDVKFVEECYKYNNGEWRNYFDALGVHPGGHGNSPDEFWPLDKPTDTTRGWTNHPSFYFRRFENHRDIMLRYGDAAKQIWLTEFGWTTQNAARGYEYGALVSEQKQADYVVRAFQRGKTKYNYIGVMMLWNLNFSMVVPHTDEKAPWSMLRQDGSPRPVYLAVKALNK